MSEIATVKRTSAMMRDEQIVELLAGGRTVADVAALVGVNVRTVYRRASDPLVAARIAERRAEQLQPFVAQTTRAVGPMLDRLEAIAADPNVPAAARVRATVSYIGIALKLRDQVTVEQRLSVVEALVGVEPADAPETATQTAGLVAKLKARSASPEESTSATDA